MLLAFFDGVKAFGKDTPELLAWHIAMRDALSQGEPELYAKLLCHSLLIAEDRHAAMVAALTAGPHVRCADVSLAQLSQFIKTALGQGRLIKLQDWLDFARFDQTDLPMPDRHANKLQTLLHLVNFVTNGTLACLLLVVVGAVGVVIG